MREVFHAVACFVAGSAFVVPLSLMTGLAVFAPLYRSASQRSARWQFHVGDVLCLLVQLQLAAAAVMLWHPRFGRSEPELVLPLCWGPIVSWWCLGVSTLAQAGVQNSWHRAVVLMLAVPVGYGGSLLVFASLAAVAASLPVIAWRLIEAPSSPALGPLLVFGGIEIALLVALVACRRVTGWVAAAATNQ